MENYFKHEHNGTDAPRIPGKSLFGAPTTALTSPAAGSLSTGGAAVLSTTDSTIIGTMLTRIAELESRLQSLGLIQ